jgi:hypothetical protein
MMLRAACVVMIAAGVADADPKAPTIVEAFNKIDRAHPVTKIGAGWTVDGKLAATVDIANGYLTFADPAKKDTTTAAIWKATNGRWFVGIAHDAPGMSWWEVDGAGDTPEESEPRTPNLAINELVMFGADAKLVVDHVDVFRHSSFITYELPRRGTTLVAHVDKHAMYTDLDGAKLPDDDKKRLRAIIDSRLYTRIELPYRGDGHFDIGKKSK